MSYEVPLSLSPSKVSSFKDCALAFRFSVIDRLPEPPSIAATKGTLVHAALERLFVLRAGRAHAGGGRRGPGPSAAAALRDDPDYAGLGLAGDDEAAFLADAGRAGARTTSGWRTRPPVRAIGLELRIEAEVGRLRLRGIIDRLELDDDGELVVTDYKTGGAPSTGYEQRRLGGVHFYSLLCEQMLGRRPGRIQLLYLRSPLAIATEPTDQPDPRPRRTLGAIWQAVERACEREDFRPQPVAAVRLLRLPGLLPGLRGRSRRRQGGGRTAGGRAGSRARRRGGRGRGPGRPARGRTGLSPGPSGPR